MMKQIEQQIISKINGLSGNQLNRFIDYTDNYHPETKAMGSFTDWYPNLSFLSEQGLTWLNEYLDTFVSLNQTKETSTTSLVFDIEVELTRAYFAYVNSSKLFKQIFYNKSIIHTTIPLPLINDNILNMSNGGTALEIAPIIIHLNKYSYNNKVLTIKDAEISMSSLYSLLILHNKSLNKDIQLPIYFVQTKSICLSDGYKKYKSYIYDAFVDYLKDNGVDNINVSNMILHKIVDKIIDNPLIDCSYDVKADIVIEVLSNPSTTSNNALARIRKELGIS